MKKTFSILLALALSLSVVMATPLSAAPGITDDVCGTAGNDGNGASEGNGCEPGIPPPHGFAGTVSVVHPPGPVPAGTLVEAYVNGVRTASTTVDDQSRYVLLVPGTGGATVTFWVGGILANESATWVSGRLDEDFDLTVGTMPAVQYTLTISSTAGGSVTVPGEGKFSRGEGTVVNLVATPGEGYRFVNWTGDVGTIADVNAASTTITMEGNYSITANFQSEEIPAVRTLTISSSAWGSVTTPGEGTFSYDQATVVNLVATPDPCGPDGNWRFVNWTGDVATIADANAASTTITMEGNYSITANFEEDPWRPAGCFIATAAYGTPSAEEINVLREFRDVVLLEGAAGSRFVAWYYRTSPPIAEFLAGNEVLSTLVREFLVDPVVWLVDVTGTMWRTP